MLELRDQCESCSCALPPDSNRAWICSYECTFCSDCVSGPLAGKCPNCGGELLRRPRRMDANTSQESGDGIPVADTVDWDKEWNWIRDLFRRSFASSFHAAVASVDSSGGPHITPIGSLMLGEPGRAVYFEKFPKNLPTNLASNQEICVMLVDSSRWFWLRSLMRGRFAKAPAVRLYGVVGDKRDASEAEVQRWQKRVQSAKWTKGHAMIWREMGQVREVVFTRFEAVQIGQMTEK